jgi:hypothetical protein
MVGVSIGVCPYVLFFSVVRISVHALHDAARNQENNVLIKTLTVSQLIPLMGDCATERDAAFMLPQLQAQANVYRCTSEINDDVWCEMLEIAAQNAKTQS